MSRGSAWAARHDRGFASAEEPQQRRLPEWEDKRAQRRAEFGGRIAAIAAQVASEVSAAVASEVSAAVAAALQAARAGHHEYLDLAPTTTSTPTASVVDEDASSYAQPSTMVHAHDWDRQSAACLALSSDLATQRSTSALAQQQQEEDAAPRQAMESTVDNVFAAWTLTTCSTRCQSRDVTVSVSARAPAATSASSKVTIGVVPERCCFDLEPAALNLTTTPALDISGDSSTAANSLTHAAVSATSSAMAPVSASTFTHFPTAVLLDATLASVPAVIAAHETHLHSVTPSTCTTKCLGDDMNTASTSSSQKAVSASSASTPVLLATVSAPFMGPAAGELLENDDDVTSPSPTYIDAVTLASGNMPLVSVEEFTMSFGGDTGASTVAALAAPAQTVVYNDGYTITAPTTAFDINHYHSTAIPGASTTLKDVALAASTELTTTQKLSPPKWSTEGLYDNTCPATSAFALGASSLTVVPHAYFNSSLMTMTSICSVGRCADEEKVIMSQLLHNDSINITNEQDQSPQVPCYVQAIALSVAFLIQLQYCCERLGMFLHPRFEFYMCVPSPWDPGRWTNKIRNMIVSRKTVQMVILPPRPADRAELSGMIPRLLLHMAVSQMQSNLFHKESACYLQAGELLKFTEALFDLKPWPSFASHSGGWMFRLTWSSIPDIMQWDNYLLSKHAFFLEVGISFALGMLNRRAIYQETWFRFLTMGSTGARLACICSGIVTIMFWTHFKLGMLPPLHYEDWSFWRYLSLDQMMLKTGHVSLCGFEPIQWKIAWSLNWECSEITRTNSKESLLPICLIQCCDGTTVLVKSSNTDAMLAKLHMLDFAVAQLAKSDYQCSDTEPVPQVLDEIPLTTSADQNDDTPQDEQGLLSTSVTQLTINNDSALTLKPVAAQLHGMPDMSRTLSRTSLPPIFEEVCTSLAAKMQHLVMLDDINADLSLELHLLVQAITRNGVTGRGNVATPAYYCIHCLDHAYFFDKVCADQNYYNDFFSDQVHIHNEYYLVCAVWYLNLFKVCIDYETHSEHQVPWDPGGSTWHRLEVKPNFKKGGMLATLLPSSWVGPLVVPIGPGLLGSNGRQRLYIQVNEATNNSARIRTASASSASVFLFLWCPPPCNG